MYTAQVSDRPSLSCIPGGPAKAGEGVVGNQAVVARTNLSPIPKCAPYRPRTGSSRPRETAHADADRGDTCQRQKDRPTQARQSTQAGDSKAFTRFARQPGSSRFRSLTDNRVARIRPAPRRWLTRPSSRRAEKPLPELDAAVAYRAKRKSDRPPQMLRALARYLRKCHLPVARSDSVGSLVLAMSRAAMPSRSVALLCSRRGCDPAWARLLVSAGSGRLVESAPMATKGKRVGPTAGVLLLVPCVHLIRLDLSLRNAIG